MRGDSSLPHAAPLPYLINVTPANGGNGQQLKGPPVAGHAMVTHVGNGVGGKRILCKTRNVVS